MQLEARFAGCMVGLGVGDALGFPSEFMNRSEIAKAFGDDGVTDFQRQWGFDTAGLYSDDTQMSIAVARALLEARLDDLDDIMRHVRREFIAWGDSPDNNRAPGQTCMDGVQRMKAGAHWFSSGDPYSKGCGAAMRTAPVGLVFHDDRERLVEVARAVSICTHAHPTGIASGVAAAAAVGAIVAGTRPEALIEQVRGTLVHDRGVPGYQERVSHDPLGEQIAALDALPSILEEPPERAFDRLGGGWIGEEAVAGGLYAFLRSPDDFRAAVLVGANAAMTDESRQDKGRCDSDTIACIAGALSGAYNGLSGVPVRWRDGVENGPMLAQLGRDLAARISGVRAS